VQDVIKETTDARGSNSASIATAKAPASAMSYRLGRCTTVTRL